MRTLCPHCQNSVFVTSKLSAARAKAPVKANPLIRDVLESRVSNAIFHSDKLSSLTHLKDLTYTHPHTLLKLRNFGVRSLRAVEEVMEKYNYVLGGNI